MNANRHIDSGTHGPVIPSRRLGIDRLRLAVCLIVIAYHAIRVFDTNDLYHVKSATRLVELDPISRFLRAG